MRVKDGEAVAVGLNGSKDEIEVRVYRPLDFFGDGTLVTGQPHTASVRARTACTVSSFRLLGNPCTLQSADYEQLNTGCRQTFHLWLLLHAYLVDVCLLSGF